MSNSSRIEAATRQHVNATLTSEQVIDLVKLSDPNWKGGVYPSDAAYKRDEPGKLVARGKVAYGDGVLEYLGANSFNVLETKDIVRCPTTRKAVPAADAAETTPTPTPKVETAVKAAAEITKSPGSSRQTLP